MTVRKGYHRQEKYCIQRTNAVIQFVRIRIRKGGVIHSEIFLPPNAPPEYQDRETLWNAVEHAEKHKKAQLAYSFDIALQNELSMEENIELAREFVQQCLVSKGMNADLAVHQPDKSDGGISNPHFHVMTTMRPLNPD